MKVNWIYVQNQPDQTPERKPEGPPWRLSGLVFPNLEAQAGPFNKAGKPGV